MSFSYPSGDVAVPEIQRLIGMLTGQVPAVLPQALKSGWITQGYVQSLTVGDPSTVSSASILTVDAADYQGELTDAQAVDVLKSLATQGPHAAGLLDGIGQVGGKALLRLLLPVLQRWITNWLTTGGLDELINKIVSGIGSPAASPAT